MKECPACNRCFADNVNHCPTDGDTLRFTITGDTMLDGRYQLERRLGAGGMGCVYKGRHVFLKTSHAIKVILPDLVGNDPSLVTRFRQEAMAAAAIRHQNIISVTDFGVVNNTTPFLVMEFVEGRSLHDLLVAEGRLRPQRAIEIMLGVTAGVGAAHQQGIVHRDLKPLNIMLRNGYSATEGVKVLDFGLAKIKSGELLGSFVAAQTQGLMGSPFYMAPEQWSDEEPDARSDIYALGIILYQMIAGEVPFKGNSIPSIMNKHLTSPPPSFSAQGIAVTPEVEHVVLRALEKDPNRRPQSISEFSLELLQALARVSSGPTVGTETSSDIAQKTISFIDPGTVPPLSSKTVDKLPAPHVSTGNPLTESAQKTDAPRGMETVALPDAQRHDTSHPANAPQGRTTAYESPASTAFLPEGQSSGPPSATTPPMRTDARFDAAPVDAAPAAQHDAKKTQPISAHFQTANQFSQPLSPQHTGQQSAAQSMSAQSPTNFASSQPGQFAQASSVVAPTRSRLPVAVWAAAGALALLCVVAGLYLLLGGLGGDEAATNSSANLSTNASANTNAGTTAAIERVKPDLVSLPGGTFMIGRNDVPPRSASVSVAYQAWAYNQWPAHSVQIAPFAIDRTEVTNAEYAEFVEKTGYPAPPDWDGKRPAAGQERFPVRNVTLEDAERFAKWRSQRDGVEYRLPTEDEWEYAARGGEAARFFPWGRDWMDGRANIDSDSLKSVGSFPDGATPQGAQDMIGNVWEWTRTEAAMYKGNNLLMLAPGDAGKIVVRGGSFQSKSTGDEPISATARRWVVRDKKDPVIGFRLIRSVN